MMAPEAVRPRFPSDVPWLRRALRAKESASAKIVRERP